MLKYEEFYIIFKKNAIQMLINRDNIFGLRVAAMRNFFHNLNPVGDKKLSEG